MLLWISENVAAIEAVSGLLTALLTGSIAWVAHRYTKRQATMQWLALFNTRVSTADLEVSQHFHPTNPLPPLNQIKGDSQKVAAILDLLNAYEQLAVSVKHKIVDERIVRDLRRAALVGTHARFHSFIEDWRKEPARETAWQQLECLSEKWSSRSVSKPSP